MTDANSRECWSELQRLGYSSSGDLSDGRLGSINVAPSLPPHGLQPLKGSPLTRLC